jgi:hypothetical protein
VRLLTTVYVDATRANPVEKSVSSKTELYRFWAVLDGSEKVRFDLCRIGYFKIKGLRLTVDGQEVYEEGMTV